MGQVSTVDLDLAKSIFQAHGEDASGEVVFRKKLGRGRLLAFFRFAVGTSHQVRLMGDFPTDPWTEVDH